MLKVSRPIFLSCTCAGINGHLTKLHSWTKLPRLQVCQHGILIKSNMLYTVYSVKI